MWSAGPKLHSKLMAELTDSHSARKSVKRFHGCPADETVQKLFLSIGEESPKQIRITLRLSDQQRGSIMSALISLLYREYCKARLAEMRKVETTAF
jgi:hypothetical protein